MNRRVLLSALTVLAVAFAAAPSCGTEVQTVLESPGDGGADGVAEGAADRGIEGEADGPPITHPGEPTDARANILDVATKPTACGQGLQAGSPWPMDGYCQDHRARSPFGRVGTPTLKWTFSLLEDAQPPWFCCAAPPVIAADGTLYFADATVLLSPGAIGGILHALNPDGTLKWSFMGYSPYTNTLLIADGSPAIAADGTIIAPGPAGLFAVSPDGQLRWVFWPPVPNVDFTPVAIGADGTIYVGAKFGSSSALYALHPDGTLAWAAPLGTETSSAPALAPDGTLYIVAGALHAFAADGTEKWTFGRNYYSTYPPAVAADGTVYFPSGNTTLVAISPDGTEKWESNNYFNGSISLGADGTVYVAQGTQFVAINPDGTNKWTYVPGDGGPLDPQTNGATVGGDGTVYWGADIWIFAIHPDGSEAWRFYGPYTPPVIGTDGTLYSAGDQGIYAIGQ